MCPPARKMSSTMSVNGIGAMTDIAATYNAYDPKASSIKTEEKKTAAEVAGAVYEKSDEACDSDPRYETEYYLQAAVNIVVGEGKHGFRLSFRCVFSTITEPGAEGKKKDRMSEDILSFCSARIFSRLSPPAYRSRPGAGKG